MATWLGEATQHLRELLPRLYQEGAELLSISTLSCLARRLGYRWKRCRRSLRSQRDPEAFAACQQQLRTVHQAEARGQVTVLYVDECRFSRNAPVPYAWQRQGQPPVELPAARGKGGQSVLGFWQAGGTGQPLQSYRRQGAFTAELFVAAVDEIRQDLRQPTVLVLDNASIHKAHLVQARQAEWAARGLTFCYLSAYSPELNKIERLWHRCKHYWIRPGDYLDEQTLLERVDDVLKRVGSDYTITLA
ncbi:MAG: IS630 family transposase [Janthinobacterium lividum]